MFLYRYSESETYNKQECCNIMHVDFLTECSVHYLLWCVVGVMQWGALVASNNNINQSYLPIYLYLSICSFISPLWFHIYWTD